MALLSVAEALARVLEGARPLPAEHVPLTQAEGRVLMAATTLDLVVKGNAKKGDVLGAARIAGIMAAKKTHELIPLCHPLRLTGIDVTFSDDRRRGVLTIETRVRTVDKTGVEMEALTAVSVAALTVYDMVKGLERGIEIVSVVLVEKTGGKADYRRP